MVVTWMLPEGGKVTPNTVAHGGDLLCEDPGAERAGGRRGTCQGPAVGPARGPLCLRWRKNSVGWGDSSTQASGRTAGGRPSGRSKMTTGETPRCRKVSGRREGDAAKPL